MDFKRQRGSYCTQPYNALFCFSSFAYRSFSLDEEDSTIMTIDFLRSRLQSQRAHYRAEKQRAEMLARKVSCFLYHAKNDVYNELAN